MKYQLSWKTLPGLHGLACSGFCAVPAPGAAADDGTVVVELAGEAERAAVVEELEARFAAERFLNTASAFETVKAYILERVAKSGG